MSTMSVTTKEPPVSRLYRCGFCSNDFSSFESCVAHVVSHTVEHDNTSKISPPPDPDNQQLKREDEGNASEGKASITCSLAENSVHSSQLGSLSSVTQSPQESALMLHTAHDIKSESTNVDAAVSAQQNSLQLNTSDQSSEHKSQPSSILVQTNSSGAFIIEADSGNCVEEDGARQAVGDSRENRTDTKKQEEYLKSVNIHVGLPGDIDVINGNKALSSKTGDKDADKLVSSGCLDIVCKKETDSSSEQSDAHNYATRTAEGVKKSVADSPVSKDKDRPYTCSECPARYRFLSSLSVHKKRHSGTEPYQCKTCKKKFWHPTNLRVHERVHSEKRLFSCKVCGHGFNQANDLRIHMRIHTGEMPLTCPMPECSKAFRDPACLRRHMNKHRGLQPHISCDMCSAKFFHPSGLARHYKRHTGQKDHVCRVCNTAFARGDTLKLHMRTHSGQKPYMCSVCRQSFSDRSYCRRHIAKHDVSLNPKIISSLLKKYSIKRENGEKEIEEVVNFVMEEVQVETEQPAQPVQKKRSSVIVPVEIPDPNGSDIPYASIEIEIPESDLVDGDECEEMVYQYGDMLITISRSAVELAGESASETGGASQNSKEAAVEQDPSTASSRLLSLQQVEHQYSRTTDSATAQQKQIVVMDTEATHSDRTVQAANSVTPVTVNSGVAVPQPLSEYNEIVASVMEVELLESKSPAYRIIPGPSGSKEKHRSTRAGERRWPCPDCNAAFFHQAELKRHQTKHTGELPYQCNICGKKVRDPSNLKRHVRTHTGERPYSCHVCGKTFRQAGHLTAHVRIHTGQRPYKCDLCPATFIEANHLRYHQKVHAGIKPYQCPDCDLSFIRNAELKRHSHVHGGEGNLKCTVCPATFSRSDALKQHLSKRHEQKLPYRCDVCSQSFWRQGLLDRHRINMKHIGDSTLAADAKSDTENNVAASALCELATGRRSATASAKDSVGIRLSPAADGTGSVLMSNTVSPDQCDTVLTLADHGEGQPRTAPSQQMEESVMTVGCGGDEQFVQRVMVDRGSVSGARVVLVESEGTVSVDNRGESNSTTSHQLQTISGDHLVPHADDHKTFILDVTSLQEPPVVMMEEPGGSDRSKSSYIIVNNQLSGDNTVSQLVHKAAVEQLAGDPGTVVDVVSGSVTLSNDSADGLVQVDSASKMENHSDPDVSQTGTVLQTCPESALESAKQSVISSTVQHHETETGGKSDLQKASSRQGRKTEKNRVVKLESGPVTTQPFVAPLRTRSGRERKVKVKFSA